MSCTDACERHTRASSSARARPSHLQGTHCPQDSTDRNRAAPAATATMSAVSSKTTKPAEPSPLPMAAIPS
jgi:hypothetical protein